MRYFRICLIAGFLSFYAMSVCAQEGTAALVGLPPNTPFYQLPVGSGDSTFTANVNLMNGNLHIEIPLYSYPERAGNTLSYKLVYDSLMWYTLTAGAYPFDTYWNPGPLAENGGGWRLVSSASDKTFNFIESTITTELCPSQSPEVGYDQTYPISGPFYFRDSNMTTHEFDAYVSNGSSCYPYIEPGVNDVPSDSVYEASTQLPGATGNFLQVTQYGITSISHADGTGDSIDTNGNQIDIVDDINNNWHDQLGRSLPAGNIQIDGTSYYPQVPSTQQFYFPVSGGTATIIFGMQQIPVCTAFGDGNVQYCYLGSSLYEPTSLQLADGRSFAFTYDAGSDPGHYGRLTGLVTPNGAALGITYSPPTPALSGEFAFVSEIQLNGQPFDFNFTNLSQPLMVRQPSRWDYATNQYLRDDIVWTFTPSGGGNIRTVYSGPYTNGVVLSATASNFDTFGRLVSVTSTLNDGTSAAIGYTYGPNLQQPLLSGGVIGSRPPAGSPLLANVSTWNYGVATSGSPSFQTNTTYSADPNLLNAHIINKPQSVKTYQGSTLVAETDYGYDTLSVTGTSGFMGTDVTSAIGHSGYPASQATGRGNLTSVSRWLSTGGTVMQTQQYNMLGEVVSSKDGNGNVIQSDYTDCFSPDGVQDSCTNKNAFAYASSTQNALQQSASSTFMFADGQPQSVRDLNNRETSNSFDSIGRTTDTFYPDGGHSHIDYGGSQQLPVTTSTVIATPSPNQVNSTAIDSMGRTTVTTAADGSLVQLTYDVFGHVTSMTNPYHSTGDSTYGVTDIYYDALGRKVAEVEPGGATLQWQYNGPSTDFYDETGNHWRRTTDALGHLVGVVEPSGATTSYTYDVLGNLKTVTQSGVAGESPRTRTFTYDSLSRLLTAANSETGTTSYSYDSNGNVITKTDSRGTQTTFAYDALNRITSKTYSVSGSTAATPNSCYRYDTSSFAASPVNLIGHLTDEWTTTGSCAAGPSSGALTRHSVLAYDAMGRVLKEQQCHLLSCTTGSPYTTEATYDLAGNQRLHTNGVSIDGVHSIGLTNSYDLSGRLKNINSSYFDTSLPATIFSVGTYNPSGAIQDMNLGAIKVEKNYDSRLRPTSETAMRPVN